MRFHQLALLASLVAAPAGVCRADVTVTIDRMTRDKATPAYKFASVPPPSADDLATGAKVSIRGDRDPNGGEAAVLVDGKGATAQDDPENNFFFAVMTTGGRLRIDLGAAKEIGQINTSSWHPDTRAPQVYKVYIAAGLEDGFAADPTPYVDPEMTGWTRIATVDTRTEAAGRTQHAVSIADADDAPLGKARYILFDIERTESDDPNGNTFYSEIDVVAVDKPPPAKPSGARLPPAGDDRAVIDTAGLNPEMAVWAEETLKPVRRRWYPEVVERLPSEGYEGPESFAVTFEADMGGTPAAAVRPPGPGRRDRPPRLLEGIPGCEDLAGGKTLDQPNAGWEDRPSEKWAPAIGRVKPRSA